MSVSRRHLPPELACERRCQHLRSGGIIQTY